MFETIAINKWVFYLIIFLLAIHNIEDVIRHASESNLFFFICSCASLVFWIYIPLARSFAVVVNDKDKSK